MSEREDTDDRKDPQRPKRIADLAEDIGNYCQGRQNYHAKKAQEFGYVGDVFRGVEKTFRDAPDDPSWEGIENAARKFNNFLRAKEEQTKNQYIDVTSAAYVLGTSVSATATMIMSEIDVQPWVVLSNSPAKPAHWSSDRIQIYARRIERLDPELGSLMRSVWQSLYGGFENAERAALLSMRQLYDHFFEILSPDDEVRASEFFSIKTGLNPSQVHRAERVEYAAKMKIRNPEIGAVLRAQTSQLIDLYGKLNELHKRGKIDKEPVKETLQSMQGLIEEWIDALGL